MSIIWSSNKTDEHVLFTAIHSLIWKIGKVNSFQITKVRMHLGMIINIRHNCAFKQNPKKFFMNNFCVPGLLPVVSPFPNFLSVKRYVKK